MLKAESSARERDITPEEFQRFEKAFRDPEFKRLFKDYIDDISNPETRKTYEAEIAALEQERGFDVRFIKPAAGFCIKTSFAKQPGNVVQQTHLAFKNRDQISGNNNQFSTEDRNDIPAHTKVFINICSSPEIGDATAVASTSTRPENSGSNDNNHPVQGHQWSIPYSLSPPRRDTDKAHNLAIVYDVIFHPNTLSKGKSNERFEKLLIQTAMEGIESKFSVELDRTFKKPRLQFKGVPTATVIRTAQKNGKHATADKKDPMELISSKIPTTVASSSSPSPSSSSIVTNKINNPKDSTGSSIINETKETSPSASSASSSSAVVELVPRHTVSQRSKFDLQEYATNVSGKYSDKHAAHRPDELVVRVEVPGVAKVDDIALDTSEKTIILHVPSKYKLELNLSYPVDDSKGKAKFDKAKSVLTITLPVKPAPPVQVPQESTHSSPNSSSNEEVSDPQKNNSEQCHGELITDSSPISLDCVNETEENATSRKQNEAGRVEEASNQETIAFAPPISSEAAASLSQAGEAESTKITTVEAAENSALSEMTSVAQKENESDECISIVESNRSPHILDDSASKPLDSQTDAAKDSCAAVPAKLLNTVMFELDE